MLGTVYFRRFAEYDRPAIADEKVRCDTVQPTLMVYTMAYTDG